MAVNNNTNYLINQQVKFYFIVTYFDKIRIEFHKKNGAVNGAVRKYYKNISNIPRRYFKRTTCKNSTTKALRKYSINTIKNLPKSTIRPSAPQNYQ